MSDPYRLIPYGMAHFEAIRRENKLYVDKTRFIRNLEKYKYTFLIRPRRFGKSCWISLLESYYDRSKTEQFETIFGGLDIGEKPTEERNRFVVMRIDFSVIHDALDTLQSNFEAYTTTILDDMCQRYPDCFPGSVVDSILSQANISAKLNRLFLHTQLHQIPLYIFIDEYDNFANTVLSRHGQDAYHSFTHADGFYRNFFATLKGGTTGGGLERLFITGVSPITLDDVTSGFNIGKNISLLAEFNELLGFTETEVHKILKYYQEVGVFDLDIGTCLGVMREWYNGYRFAEEATADLYNTDMVLYYLTECIPNQSAPRELIDNNIRIDYGKLRHLFLVNQQLNGNFDQLKSLIGEEEVTTEIQQSFPLAELTQPENFLSLLYYFGLLSIRGYFQGTPQLAIPNQTVKRLMYGYLRDAYKEVEVFPINLFTFTQLVRKMAFEGAWKPAFEFLAQAIETQTRIRDYLNGEKVVQGFLAAYLNVTDFFLFHSEYEFQKGYVDLYLEPFLAKHTDLPFGYLIELKYIKRGDALSETTLSHEVEQATAQLQGYLQDERLQQLTSVIFIGLVIVFHGWEMVWCEDVKVH